MGFGDQQGLEGGETIPALQVGDLPGKPGAAVVGAPERYIACVYAEPDFPKGQAPERVGVVPERGEVTLQASPID